MNPLDHLVVQAIADFAAATDAAALENAKALYLGKSGQITEQMKDAISRSLKDVKVEVMKFDMNNLPPSLRRELNEEQEEDNNDN